MKNKKIILYSTIIFVITIIAFSLFSLFKMQNNLLHPEQATAQVPTMTRMSLTSYDKELARKMMDKNNDGKCDACGMPVEICMDSGQLQCNMDSNSTIGIFGSDHIHADFKVYINGKFMDFADEKYYMKSSFLHLDDNLNKEDASSVLHMHATGVPIWILLDSIGFKFNKTCLETDSQSFCNNQDSNIKFYVNNQPNNEFENYVFKDLDKILISYGNVNEDIQKQLESITNYSGDH